LLLVLAAACAAQEWTQWRGPGRDGVVPAFREPAAWPGKLNLKWRVKVGEGHSSPVVASGRIYLLTRLGDDEVVSCLRPENGQIVWQERYPAPYQMNPAAMRHGKGAKSTPLVHDGRLFTLGIAGALSCFDAATGKLHWRKQFAPPLYGTAMSPLADAGRVVAHVGGRQGGLIAFDAATGAARWNWNGDGPAYASPVIAGIGGVRQVVTQTENHVVAVSAASGELLWRMPFRTAYDQNSVTPLLAGDALILSGLNNGVTAVRPALRGGKWVAQTVWHNPDVAMYMSSPVLVGDGVIGLSHRNKGQYFCLDARTGAVRWTSEPRQGDNAAILKAGPVLLLLNTDAELTVARTGARGLEAVRKYTVADSPTWAHPAIVGRGILIKDAASLALWAFE
jgi:outer membrane protein assembly factor BamB